MHSLRSHRTMLSVAGVIGVALVLAACGSSAKKTSSSASPPTTAGSSSTSASSSTTAASPSGGSAISTASSSKGQILVDSHGKSLYVFDNDTASKIACTTGCVSLWPPLVVPNGSSAPTLSGVMAKVGTVMRPDGTTQLTSDGRPLYTFKLDTAAGQVRGDGFAKLWHVALATGNGSPPAVATTPTTAPSSSSSGGSGY